MSENTSEKGFFRGTWDTICKWFNDREPGFFGLLNKVAGAALMAPLVAGFALVVVGELVVMGPSLLANVTGGLVTGLGSLDESKERMVRFIVKGMVAAGAVVAGFFGSWFMCGWLAINALAI